ncbi:MAG: UDP-N-acetylmuramate--L-alanine ligase, UDP-N-acetylmuramate--alanine ligase [Candidatus Parcubacteria bacterium]|jgi:UDP-N-acetylmuramate--alanine ligase
MSKIDLTEISRIHFIGIGGIGMSALARFLRNEKKTVQGTDRSPSDITATLQTEGVTVFSGHSAEHISDGIDLVIYTEAVNPTTEGYVELEAAREKGIPTINYFEALGLAVNPYYLIAVAGTHGKTTTTAMLTDIFEAAGKDPTAVIGSLRAKTKSNFRAGKSKYAIVEACEYKRDFLYLKPDVLVITNLEYEHTDYYKDLADVQDAFRSFIEQVNEGGVVVTDIKNPNIVPILKDSPVKVLDYNEFFDVNLPLKQPGMHNRMNAAAALTVAEHEKLNVGEATKALSEFAGTWRRFEYKGEWQGTAVYDDYAHHPTEIKATLGGLRELYPDRNIVAIAELHTYSRTTSLFDDFAKVTALADCFYFLPIYAAREENTSGVSVKELAVKSLEYNPHTSYVPTYEAMIDTLKQTVNDRDVIVFLGAGNITKLATELLSM